MLYKLLNKLYVNIREKNFVCIIAFTWYQVCFKRIFRWW